MQGNKLDGLLSLAAKGGNVESGEFCTEKAVKTGKAYLVLCAEDASGNTKKHFHDMCTYYKVPFYCYQTKERLGHCIGKEMRACMACTDFGLSNAIMKYLEEEGKCEAFFKMPSDDMRPNRRLGSDTLIVGEDGRKKACLK